MHTGHPYKHMRCIPYDMQRIPQIAKFMGPTWGPPGSCLPQMDPMLAPWTLLSGSVLFCFVVVMDKIRIECKGHPATSTIAVAPVGILLCFIALFMEMVWYNGIFYKFGYVRVDFAWEYPVNVNQWMCQPSYPRDDLFLMNEYKTVAP